MPTDTLGSHRGYVMKKLGIIGGIGPEATMSYYSEIIAGYQHRMGSLETLPEIVINSINMYHMFSLLEVQDYAAVATYLADAARELQQAGADFGLMCGNTPHIVFQRIQEQVDLPLLSIITPSLKAAQDKGLRRLGLLGTKFTMQHDFFTVSFIRTGIDIITPSPEDQTYIHRKIVEELENGIVLEQTRQEMIRLITTMIHSNHLDGIILGCTELPLLLQNTDIPVEILDIAKLHIQQAVEDICA